LEQAARIVVVRSRHQERMRGRGRMAALGLGEAEATALLADTPGVEIAAINSARSVTVAGTPDAIVWLGRGAARRGIASRELDLDFAFHSAAMDPIRDGLVADLGAVVSQAPAGEFISTVTGMPVGGGELDALHWWRNVREPVRFGVALQRLIDGG